MSRRWKPLGAVLVVLLVTAGPAAAQVKIKLWHAMGDARYEAITKDIAEGFNKVIPITRLTPCSQGATPRP